MTELMSCGFWKYIMDCSLILAISAFMGSSIS